MTPARFNPGASSLSSSSHLPPMPNSNWENPVASPPGRARAIGIARANGVRDHDEHDWYGAGRPLHRVHAELPFATMRSGASATNSWRNFGCVQDRLRPIDFKI